MGEKYYSLSVEQALSELKTGKNGLSTEEAKKRLQEIGPNELRKEAGINPAKIFLGQFKNALILLLVFAGALSFFLGENVETIAIFAIILLNAVLGFVQEYRAERAIEALKKISAPTAKVIRNGTESKIPAKDVVPGDIVVLEAGDIVPADGRLIQLSSLQIDEASLTGESVPSQKDTKVYKPGTPIADQENMAFMGTIVTYGKALYVVTETGMRTQFGKIAKSLQTEREVQTPLQKKFTQLAKQIGIIAVVLIAIVLAAGMIEGHAVATMVMFALALTVSTVPNSLPIIVTVSLSLGAKRLAKKNMLIKKLPAAESLGAATIICSDKTGTLTKNQMTITNIYTNHELIKVSGSGYIPKGQFFHDGKQINPKTIELLLKTGKLCNNAKLILKGKRYSILGDPTEGSLIVLAGKANLNPKTYTLVEELPFDSERKIMSMVYKNNDRNEAYVKGAPDMLLKKCTRIIENGRIRQLRKADREKILHMNAEFAKRALRVLALAYRDLPNGKYTIENVEKDLIFIGLVGMIAPPRDEVKEAVQKCKKAGIDVMIITGDHAITAQAVAQQIGLLQQGDKVITGEQLEKMSDKQLEKEIKNIRIIARALPIQKSRVVDVLQKKGHIVAMTGDGVNDAPALKKADIGIAMGITGTDVAKEVSKATLVDDNFATIVNAIEEGRNIYTKMIRSATYLLSCNAGEIISVFFAIMLRFPLPLLPLQVLLMNLLTDDLPALGLGAEPNDPTVMEEQPRNPKQRPITKQLFFSIIGFGIIMGAGTLFMFFSYLNGSVPKAQTVAFTTLVMFQMFAVLSSRTSHHSVKALNPFANKWLFGAVIVSLIIQVLVVSWVPLQEVFGTVALEGLDWVKIVLIASLGFVMMELTKVFFVGKKNT
ncbi:cation-translocating P-type ATPase, partial [Candidatus Woesearchaeota archaeon]|nr:cation-translocating P-type ATPase [Candidatus Woesearchaeota archaeon]